MVSDAGTAAVFTVISDYAPSDRKTEDLVRTLRDDTIPTVTRGQEMRVDVGGATAGYIDLASQISSKLPMVIAIVLALSFLLLALAFRAVLVPVKAVIVNLLSTAAAFGVVTYAFGHHWSSTAIGLEGSVPIASFVPLMMFAILFGNPLRYRTRAQGPKCLSSLRLRQCRRQLRPGPASDACQSGAVRTPHRGSEALPGGGRVPRVLPRRGSRRFDDSRRLPAGDCR